MRIVVTTALNRRVRRRRPQEGLFGTTAGRYGPHAVNNLELPLPLIDDTLTRALSEDLGAGDVTTESCVPEERLATAHGVARKAIVVCGIPIAARVFSLIDASLQFTTKVAEGASVEPGTVLWAVEGRARSILMAERVALNFTQRMCGISTATRRYVAAVPEG